MSALPPTDLRTDLAVHRHGLPPGAGPTLLLLHGLTDSGLAWPAAARRWGERWSVVSYDARGHGGSPRFTPEEIARHPGDVMVEDAVGLLEQLDRPVVVGHSLGGAVALTAGVRRPELVRALVLEDPAPLGPGEPLRSDHGEQSLAGVRESRAAADDDALFALRKAKHPRWPEEELLPTGYAERDMDDAYLGCGEFKPTTPWAELVAAVSVPTLVVSGDRSDELCIDDPMERVLVEAGNPQVTLVRVPGAGHCVRRDQPAAFHRVVDGWMAGVAS